jgi:hypothetical protein
VSEAIFSVPGLVDVTFRDELNAVCLKWHSEYDEGAAVRDAVHAGLGYARAHGVTNWLADLSTSRKGLSDADLAWVTGEEFRSEFRASPLRRFVLVPPLPETGQDTSWLAGWEKNTLAAFGADIRARLASDMDEIRHFFSDTERTREARP